jgi:hypothetical protein
MLPTGVSHSPIQGAMSSGASSVATAALHPVGLPRAVTLAMTRHDRAGGISTRQHLSRSAPEWRLMTDDELRERVSCSGEAIRITESLIARRRMVETNQMGRSRGRFVNTHRRIWQCCRVFCSWQSSRRSRDLGQCARLLRQKHGFDSPTNNGEWIGINAWLPR